MELKWQFEEMHRSLLGDYNDITDWNLKIIPAFYNILIYLRVG